MLRLYVGGAAVDRGLLDSSSAIRPSSIVRSGLRAFAADPKLCEHVEH